MNLDSYLKNNTDCSVEIHYFEGKYLAYLLGKDNTVILRAISNSVLRALSKLEDKFLLHQEGW